MSEEKKYRYLFEFDDYADAYEFQEMVGKNYAADHEYHERTCHIVPWETVVGTMESFPACSECNHVLEGLSTYCSNCGAKVVPR